MNELTIWAVTEMLFVEPFILKHFAAAVVLMRNFSARQFLLH